MKLSAKKKIELLEQSIENLIYEHQRLLIENGVLDTENREEIRACRAAMESEVRTFAAPVRNSITSDQGLQQARRADFLLSGIRRPFVWYGILTPAQREGHQHVEQALDAAIEKWRIENSTEGKDADE